MRPPPFGVDEIQDSFAGEVHGAYLQESPSDKGDACASGFRARVGRILITRGDRAEVRVGSTRSLNAAALAIPGVAALTATGPPTWPAVNCGVAAIPFGSVSTTAVGLPSNDADPEVTAKVTGTSSKDPPNRESELLTER